MNASTDIPVLPRSLKGLSVYCVGIKGSGMTALVDVLTSRGATVRGSDTDEVFYTDAILRRLGAEFVEGFRAENLPGKIDLLVYSAAYDPTTHPELVEAHRRGIKLHTYPEILGSLSRQTPCVAISGVHGKSTTTAMAGTMIAALQWPATVIVGTSVPTFDGRSALCTGDQYLVLEACEYRRHFLNYDAECIVITSAELDHPDYYASAEHVIAAFVEMAGQLPTGGTALFCADDPGASEVAARVSRERPDVRLVSYGFSAQGPLAIRGGANAVGRSLFRLAGLNAEFSLAIPGRHNILNAAAALGVLLYLSENHQLSFDLSTAGRALGAFAGTRRRAEIVGERDGVLVLDDYGHHPTAIRKTLEGLRDFYPGRRLFVDFMPHTYSRTTALLGGFAESFASAHHVVLHKIYASAREENPGGVTGRTLYDEVVKRHDSVAYFDEPLDALPHLRHEMRPGDLLVTLGAGDNWKVGQAFVGTGDHR